jgi:hypothetical protein
MISPEQIRKILTETMSHPGGPAGVLIASEMNRGAKIIPLGAKKPFAFPMKDWRRGVISLKGDVVRIVAIEARKPKHGALKRLIASIQAAGLKPEIVAVMLDMPAILEHWGWTVTYEADEFGKLDVWRPPGVENVEACDDESAIDIERAL